MIDNMNTQSRILLAIALAILFLVVYSYVFPNPALTSQNATEPQITTQVSQNQAPQITSEAKVAPIQTASAGDIDETIVKVETKDFELHIDKLGRISKYFLNGENFRDDNNERIQLLDSSFALPPLEIRFSDQKLNDEAFKTPYVADKSEIAFEEIPQVLTLVQELESLTVTKTITFKQIGYDVEVSLSEPRDYFITTGFRPNILADGYAFHGAIIKKNDDSLEKIDDGDVKSTATFSNASFAAASDRYYTSLLANFDERINVIVTGDKEKNPNIFIQGKQNFKLQGYIGPKSRANIRAVNEKLDDVIEYGFFTWISKPVFSLLYFIHSNVGNWGWSIVIITILIRLVLYPLTYKGMVSMNKLKELAPKVKELQEKYKDDKQKLNAHVMETYKKHGANPMGGCLPIVLQIPIFFAIYRVLVNTIELKNAEWIFWVKDLAVQDPYFVLPIAMGLTMFIQQKITPTTFTDPTQEKIMKFLPLIFTFFFLWFPAGLTLYWFVNNLFSVGQQFYVNRIFARKKEAEKEKAHQ